MTQTLKASTVRFGEIDLTAEDIITMPEGILGFPQSTSFVLIQHKEGSPFRWLQSLDQPEIAFLVVDPAIYVADYTPEMPEDDARELQLDEDTPQLVYTIVTIPRGKPEELTLNLAGPIVINAASRKARQVVLEDPLYGTKFAPQVQTKQTEEAAA